LRIWIALVCLAGCVEVGAVHCDDGTVCPAGTRCGDPVGCISPGDCGDGLISGDEMCDDGNTIGGDGCAANCRSLELCGNTIRDEAAGEECDDGNLASHDGCSSGCLVETATWQQLPGAGPPERLYAAITWDPDRGRVVMTGGEYSPSSGITMQRADTWYMARRVWMQGPDLPAPVALHAMASDNRGAILVFGGETVNGECGQPGGCRGCWLLGDTAWTSCASTLAVGRIFHAMTTAPDGGILVFGGTPFTEMPWEWRAGAWSPAAANAPIGRSSAAAAFDPIANVSVVMGGTGTAAIDTVTWDGASWARTTNTLTRLASAAVFDSARRRMLAFGGQITNSGGVSPTNLVDWTGTGDWHEVPAAVGPGGRFGHVMVYDPIEHGTVVFGGQLAASNVIANDTWFVRWESATADERCDGTDADGDGLAGCADEDCWARCTPRCAPGAVCGQDDPRCGDGVCNPYLEDAALCPDDC
jgi:cysteine-rich repeat protein